MDSYESSSEEATPESLERDIFRTIKEFAKFVSSITHDLEQQEEDAILEAEENGEEPPPIIWRDSTFIIDLTTGLLNTLFEPDELMKYYILYVLPMKPWLRERQEDFFLKNDHIYLGAPPKYVAFFKNLWAVPGAMTDKEKITSWEFWDVQIEIVEDWQELTGWEDDGEEDLLRIPVDYEKAMKNAKKNGKDNDGNNNNNNIY